MLNEPKHRRLLFPMLLLAGLLLRLAYVIQPPKVLDSDNALYGLMAKHITEGSLPLYTYGQHYMGSLESLVAAPFFILFGPSIYALKLSPLLFTLLFLAAIYLLGRELYGPVPALWALAYAAAAPPPLMQWGSAPRGGYAETLFFGTALLWLALRILRRSGEGWGEWIAFGFLAGLGFWTHFLIGYYLLPAGVVLAVGLGRRLLGRRAAAAAAAFLAGSLPFWIYNIPRGFVSLRMGAVGTGSPGEGLRHLLGLEVLELLHLSGKYFDRLPLAGRPWLYVGTAAYLLLGIPLLWRAVVAAAGFLARRRKGPGEGIFLIFLLSFLLLFSGSRFGLTHTVRYALPLFSVLAFLGPGALAGGSRRRRRLATGIWCGLIAANIFFLLFDRTHAEPSNRLTERTLAALIEALDEGGERRGVADYWQSARINFLTGERVIFSEPEGEHYLPYQFLVESSPRAAFLYKHGSPLPDALAARGVRFREQSIHRLRLMTGIEVPAERLLPIPATALGGEGETRWTDGIGGTHPWAEAGGGALDEVTVDLGRVSSPALIRVVADGAGRTGEWTVRSSPDGRLWTTVLEHRSQEPVFVAGPRAYGGGMYRRLELLLEPLPARYLRVSRRPAGRPPLAAVEEIFLYESSSEGGYPEIPEEAVAFLRRRGADFVYADRWESALLTAALGADRAPVPYNFRYHAEDRTGTVESGRRTAFLLPSSEAPLLRGPLAPAGIDAEKEFGDYTVLLADLPGDGPSGLVWTGFSLLYDGPEGKASWLRRLAREYAARGSGGETEVLLRRAVEAFPGYYLARRELAETVAAREPSEGALLREALREMFSGDIPVEAEFDGGVRLLGIDLEMAAGGLLLTGYWRLESPPDEGLWAFAHFTGKGEPFQDDFPLSEIGSPYLAVPGNIIRHTRRIGIDLPPTGKLHLKLGLWRPARRRRVKVKSGRGEIQGRAIILRNLAVGGPARIPSSSD